MILALIVAGVGLLVWFIGNHGKYTYPGLVAFGVGLLVALSQGIPFIG